MPKCQNWKQLIRELDKAKIKTEFKTKGNTTTVEGIRFEKNGYKFNGSKVDRMFSYSKIDYQLKQNARQSMQQDQAQSASVSTSIESIGSALGGLLNIQPGSGYNEDQAYPYRQPKKRKKRKYGRQI